MSSDEKTIENVAAHYHHRDIGAAIKESLDRAGEDADALTPEQFAAIDEFHVGGRNATVQMARELELYRPMQVLDLGSSLGGPSRYLAREFGCRVVGLDLSGEYCRVATEIAKRQGLNELVTYCQGNALAIPFGDCSFDLVWTQHTAMNIPDKPRLYREIFRVLKKGGRLALYDITAGKGGEIHYPVPWSREPATNFLIAPERLSALLKETGYQILSWNDLTREGLAWFKRRQEKMAKEPGPPPLGLHLLLGPDFKQMAKNQVLNLEQDRIALIQAVLRRPDSV